MTSSWRVFEHAAALTEVANPSLAPDTGPLRNLVGARTHDTLKRTEGELSYDRAEVLADRPVLA